MDQFYKNDPPRQSPIITRPNRSIHFSRSVEDFQSKQNYTQPLTLSFSRNASQQVKPPPPGTLQISRAPVVHCFVCDHANAKVKILTDQFIELLTKSSIKVYVERYLTHQPGFQVRAASLNTQADFFFQIHSKTAGAGHVRLYLNGQPKRMTKEEAVAAVWSWWRLRCGALTKEETDLISHEKIFAIFKDFLSIDSKIVNLTSLQQQIKTCLENGSDIQPVLSLFSDYENALKNAVSKINQTPPISTDWIFEPGTVLQNCSRQNYEVGLSHPLRSLLLSIIDQTLKKCRGLKGVIDRNYIQKNIGNNKLNGIGIDDEELNNEIPIDELNNDQRDADGSLWQMMVESVGEDRIGSVKIASYGESPTVRSCDRISTPIFKFDDDF